MLFSNFSWLDAALSALFLLALFVLPGVVAERRMPRTMNEWMGLVAVIVAGLLLVTQV